MNKVRGALTLEIGGKSYRARLTINSICSLETVLDDEVTSIISNFIQKAKAGGLSMRVLRAFLWAMLIDDKPELTLAEAGDLLDQATPAYVVSKVLEILPITFPELRKSTPEAAENKDRP
jgi:hypothetical protein